MVVDEPAAHARVELPTRPTTTPRAARQNLPTAPQNLPTEAFRLPTEKLRPRAAEQNKQAATQNNLTEASRLLTAKQNKQAEPFCARSGDRFPKTEARVEGDGLARKTLKTQDLREPTRRTNARRPCAPRASSGVTHGGGGGAIGPREIPLAGGKFLARMDSPNQGAAMDPVTLAVVTTAASTLAMEAGKTGVGEIAKDAWTKVKGLFGWSKDPATEDLAQDIAKALTANPDVAQQIATLLKTSNSGTASRLMSKVTITVTNTTGNITAGRDVNNIQGKNITFGPGTKFGGG